MQGPPNSVRGQPRLAMEPRSQGEILMPPPLRKSKKKSKTYRTPYGRIQNIVIRAEHYIRIGGEVPGSKVGTGPSLLAETNKILDVPHARGGPSSRQHGLVVEVPAARGALFLVGLLHLVLEIKLKNLFKKT